MSDTWINSGTGRVLTVNGGSSSIKFAMFETGPPPKRVHHYVVERTDARHVATEWIEALERDGRFTGLTAIGHRVVHGGPTRFDPQLVTFELLSDLKSAVSLDPDHLPAEIALIEAVSQRWPNIPQVACFDTAFHRNLPTAARMLPIPRRYADAGVHRYGFHGLSYAYLLEELARQAGPEAARGRVIFAHLGSGASMAAVLSGRCIDTTMGFTPAGGLMMGTRSGDLDPGVLVYLQRLEGLTADQLDVVVNRQSGLFGVSGTSADMRKLLAKHASDSRAAEAIELFCYQARKCVGAFAATLGGLDTLVFAGGIGEHAPEVRARICTGLEFLGVRLDAAANAANSSVISEAKKPVTVRVIPTDEEIVIAKAVFSIVGGQSP